MKLKLLPVIFLSLLPICGRFPVLATTALENYRQSYYSYRMALEDYKLAREEYLKWKTLAARDGVVVKGRTILLSVSETLNTYFNLLKETVDSQSHFDAGVKDLSTNLLEKHFDFLFRFKGEVAGAESPSDLESLSLKLDRDATVGHFDADLVQTALRLAQIGQATAAVENLATEVKALVEGDSGYPQRDRILGDWVVKISNKIEASRQAQADLWTKLGGYASLSESDKSSFLKDAIEEQTPARNLLIEVTGHLLEIVRKPQYE